MKKKHRQHLRELEAENEYLKSKMHIYEKLLFIKYNLKGREIRSFVDYIEEVWYQEHVER